MFSALTEPDYRRFWIAQFISNIGGWMQTVAQGWLVLRLTGSPFLLGFVGFVNSLPVLFLMLPSGVLADRYDRRHLLRAAQATQALCALFLATSVFLERITVWQIAGVAFISGAATAVSSPTYQAMVLDLLSDRAHLANAIAMNSFQFNLSRVVGPLVAGVLLSTTSPFTCFLANAGSFIPLLWVLTTLTPRQLIPGSDGGSVWSRLREGLLFVRRQRLILLLILTVAAASLFGYPYVTLMPALASLFFGSGASGLALLMGALGAGALCGALVLAARHATEPTRGIPLIVASLLVFGASLGSVYFLRSVILVGVALFIAGLTMVSCIGSVNTLLQHLIPDAMRGRVLSMYTFSFFGTLPIGNLVAGAVAERWGIRMAFLVMSGGLLVAGLLAGWRLRRELL